MRKKGVINDELDLQLLDLVQTNNQVSADDLSKSIALSGSAITRRLRRLRQEKIIVADRAILADRYTNRRLSALVQVQLAHHAPEKGLQDLKEKLVASKSVQMCLAISGAHDLLLLVQVRDMNDFNDFADSTLASHSAVHRYETSFVKRRLKMSSFIALDERDVGE